MADNLTSQRQRPTRALRDTLKDLEVGPRPEADTPLDAPLARPRPPASTREPSGTFGRYRLLDKIGSGAMADIYRAMAVGAQGFERLVAIKRIRHEASQVADIGKLFAEEARVSALLEHPNIVQVYDFGMVAGSYYIAMEYLKGKNLEEVLSSLSAGRKRLTPALAVLIAREVARGLAYAHDFRDGSGRPLQIVHGDVSPPNIMLVAAGAVKLLDFGIARVQSGLRVAPASSGGRSQVGPEARLLFKGKSPYLAPEALSGGRVDGRSDLFSLGVVLWEMLTGQRLFGGDSDLDVRTAVLNNEIPPPSRFAPEVPMILDRLVLTALDRDPDRRHQSAEEMAGHLEGVMATLPSRHGDLQSFMGRLFGGATPAPVARPRPLGPDGKPAPDGRELATRSIKRPPDREVAPARTRSGLLGEATAAAMAARAETAGGGAWGWLRRTVHASQGPMLGAAVVVVVGLVILGPRLRRRDDGGIPAAPAAVNAAAPVALPCTCAEKAAGGPAQATTAAHAAAVPTPTVVEPTPAALAPGEDPSGAPPEVVDGAGNNPLTTDAPGESPPVEPGADPAPEPEPTLTGGLPPPERPERTDRTDRTTTAPRRSVLRTQTTPLAPTARRGGKGAMRRPVGPSLLDLHVNPFAP